MLTKIGQINGRPKQKVEIESDGRPPRSRHEPSFSDSPLDIHKYPLSRFFQISRGKA
jgi:hypothetical protein